MRKGNFQCLNFAKRGLFKILLIAKRKKSFLLNEGLNIVYLMCKCSAKK